MTTMTTMMTVVVVVVVVVMAMAKPQRLKMMTIANHETWNGHGGHRHRGQL